MRIIPVKSRAFLNFFFAPAKKKSPAPTHHPRPSQEPRTRKKNKEQTPANPAFKRAGEPNLSRPP